jgi:hypothetical protein
MAHRTAVRVHHRPCRAGVSGEGLGQLAHVEDVDLGLSLDGRDHTARQLCFPGAVASMESTGIP